MSAIKEMSNENIAKAKSIVERATGLEKNAADDSTDLNQQGSSVDDEQVVPGLYPMDVDDKVPDISPVHEDDVHDFTCGA